MVLCVLYFDTIFYNFFNSSFLLKEYMIHRKASEMKMNIAKKESTQKLNHWKSEKSTWEYTYTILKPVGRFAF